MIICHSRKFIFVKPKKVAGSSVHWALEQHCQEGDIVVRSSWEDMVPHDCDLPGVFLLRQPPAFRWFHEGGHKPLKWAEQHVDGEQWQDYFKFTLVRNPWDRMVSAFWFDNYRKVEEGTPLAKIKNKFQDWLGHKVEKWTDWQLYANQGKLAVDFVGRFENLQGDFDKICERIGVPTRELPRLVSHQRLHKAHYSQYYNPVSRKLVAVIFKRQIKAFDYRFEYADGRSPRNKPMGVKAKGNGKKNKFKGKNKNGNKKP